MEYKQGGSVKPRIIIHGGAGNITRDNLPAKAYNAYKDTLEQIVEAANSRLRLPGATALDVATYAVTLLENNGMFNSGHGAVYTTNGTHELEASVMVSRGYRKRGVGIMNVTRAKNPILVAREMLIRGERDDGGGAQGHCQLQGAVVDDLAEEWGLEIVPPSYFWTKRRWIEHRNGLGRKADDETYQRHKRQADCSIHITDAVKTVSANHRDSAAYIDHAADIAGDGPSWDGHEYLPQGTVGAVVLDSTGTICCATSTGGLTNKLPGRIGDTPTLGAGFWAEEWTSTLPKSAQRANAASTIFGECVPVFTQYALSTPLPRDDRLVHSIRAVGMSGTGNGDSFLRVDAVRTAAAMARFQTARTSSSAENTSLQDAVTAVAGPGGVLQQSAEDRWHKTGEGEGGIIGIELANGEGSIVFDYNCGGMFHSWIDDAGRARFQVFKDEVDV